MAKPFLLALGLSLALVPLCRLLATRMGRVAHPREDRWHRQPVALLGGVAIGLSLFTGAAVFGLGSQVPVLHGCALLMFLTGLIDDLVNLKPSTKLIVQIALGIGAAVLRLPAELGPFGHASTACSRWSGWSA